MTQINDGYSGITSSPIHNQIIYNENPPEPFMKAIANDTYTKGDAKFSVTELIVPSRVVALNHEHGEQTRTPFSMIDSLMGRAIHNIMEDNDQEGIAEEILYTTIEGVKIKGQFDRLEDGIIKDYKSVKVSSFKAKANEDFYDWVLQLNCYAEILREHGVEVEGLAVNAFLKDWSPIERDRYEDYPFNPWPEVHLKLMPPEEIRTWMTTRVRSHLAAMEDLPLCSDEDRWASPYTFAMKKQGRDRAVKLFKTAEEAKEWYSYQTDKSQLFLERRPSTSRRCRHYCPVSQFCSQWATLKSEEDTGPILIPLNDVAARSSSFSIME